jgi:hypothetical protein
MILALIEHTLGNLRAEDEEEEAITGAVAGGLTALRDAIVTGQHERLFGAVIPCAKCDV